MNRTAPRTTRDNMSHVQATRARPAIVALGWGVLAIVLVATSGHAQGTDARSAAARERERASLYNDGLALVEAGRWEEALYKFQAVVAIRSAPRALVALALAQEKTGQLTAAKRTYLKTQAEAREAGEIEIVERASSSLIALELLIPRLALRFAARPADAAITLDGVPVIATPEGIQVDPGKHRIVVTAEGHRPFELSFEVSQRQRKEILVELNREPDAGATRVAEPQLAPVPDRSTPSRFGPPLPVWILAGAGATATAAGLIVRFNGQSDYDAASADCQDNHCTSNDAMTRGNAARRRMLVGSVIAGVGSLTIAGAGVWWALSPSSSRPVNRSATLSARVYPSADGCSLIFDGSF
jgi:hypothetical protein